MLPLLCGLSRAEESLSRKTVVFACLRRMDAGAIWLISPCRQDFTACAFRASGTTTRISFAFNICRTVMEIARVGTSERDANQPSPTCRLQQVGEGWFASLSEVPTRAISMTVRQILKAKEILVVVPDARKAQAVKSCLQGEISQMAPASILRKHANTTVFLDKLSSALLSPQSKGSIA